MDHLYYVKIPWHHFTDLGQFSAFEIKYTVVEVIIRMARWINISMLNFWPYILLIEMLTLSKGMDNVSTSFFDLRNPFLLVVVILIVGLGEACLLYGMLDAEQFYYNLFPILNVLLIVSLVVLLFAPGRIVYNGIRGLRLCATCVLGLLLMTKAVLNFMGNRGIDVYDHQYSDEYVLEVAASNQHSVGLIGVEIEAPSEFARLRDKQTRMMRLGTFTKFLKQYATSINISVMDVGSWSEDTRGVDKRLIAYSTFYQFVQAQKDQRMFTSIEQSQVDFIDEFDIKYAIATKRAEVSAQIMQKVKRQIVDSLSGERFLLFTEG